MGSVVLKNTERSLEADCCHGSRDAPSGLFCLGINDVGMLLNVALARNRGQCQECKQGAQRLSVKHWMGLIVLANSLRSTPML